MQVGLALDFSAHMYSIHFLKILYHYMCTTRSHQWGKHSGATHRGQFCQWRASINPHFASTINCRSRWGSKHPLNSCTSCNSCNSCKARKSNPEAPSVQPLVYVPDVLVGGMRFHGYWQASLPLQHLQLPSKVQREVLALLVSPLLPLPVPLAMVTL